MDDEHRIKLMGKLCTDVLDAVVDGSLPLNQMTSPLIADTLSIISSQVSSIHIKLCNLQCVICYKLQQIKLKCMKPVEEDQMGDEMQANAATAASNAIKQKIISQVSLLIPKNNAGLMLDNILGSLDAMPRPNTWGYFGDCTHKNWLD